MPSGEPENFSKRDSKTRYQRRVESKKVEHTKVEMAERVVRLPNRLKGFEYPDTSSQFEGWVAPGTYDVLEERRGGETDYARLLAPSLGVGEPWICTRWKNQAYASLEDVEPVAAPVRSKYSSELPDSKIWRHAELITSPSSIRPPNSLLADANFPVLGLGIHARPPNDPCVDSFYTLTERGS
jgi:hypothetical protein